MWKYDFYSCFPTLLKSHLRMGVLLKICCMVLEQPFCKKTSRGMLLSFSVLFLKICARASKIFVIKDFKQFDWVFSRKNLLKKKKETLFNYFGHLFFFFLNFFRKLIGIICACSADQLIEVFCFARKSLLLKIVIGAYNNFSREPISYTISDHIKILQILYLMLPRKIHLTWGVTNLYPIIQV